MNTKGVVLIVDDDVDYLAQMKFHIEQMGFETITADSQKEAENIIAGHKPDLAIFDLMMEKQDSGFILSYLFKNRYPHVPVIIVTSVTAETGMIFNLETKEDKKWIKADLCLEKGIRPDQLHREINRLMLVNK